MESLASLFVGLVTVAHTLVPGANVTKVLALNPLSPNQAVLSETDETSSNSSPRLKEIGEKIQKRLEEREQKIATFKERRQERSEDRQEKRAEFKEKLADIKDERKQEIVEKIDTNLITLNTKWVSKWNEVLTRLSSIIVKIETRTETLKANGKDTTEIEDAIASAKSSIETAQAAVTAQEAKTYTITISDEDSLGQSVKTTINDFHNDIKNTRDTVNDARKAVMKILPLLKGKSTPEETETP